MVENTRSIDMIATLVLSIGIIAAIGPFWIVFVTATSSYDTTLRGLSLIPGDELWANLAWVFTETLIPRQILNSFLIAAMVTIGKASVAFLSAFALVYFNLRLKKLIFAAIIVTLMLPLEMRIVPTYAVAANILSPFESLLDVTSVNALLTMAFGHGIDLEIGILDTHLGMALPLIATATGTFLFRQFFQTLPPTLVEAARMDGAGPVGFMRDILLPLSAGPFAALGVMMFLSAWN
jgi:sn-glycerol 3-phosphate transport system permease protein